MGNDQPLQMSFPGQWLPDLLCSGPKIAKNVIHASTLWRNFKAMKAETAAYHYRNVESIKEFIDNNLDSPLNLKVIANALGISYFHLARIFKSVHSLTIARYIARQRFAQSLEEILYTSSPVSGIAIRYGFNNYETYTRGFKKEYNVAPADLRKILHTIRTRRKFETEPKVILRTSCDPLSDDQIRQMLGVKEAVRMIRLQFLVAGADPFSKDKFKIKEMPCARSHIHILT